jgi:hypothetical protein
MKQRAGRSDDNPRLSTPKAGYDCDTLARSSLLVNLHEQLECIRTNGECHNKFTVNLADIVLELLNEFRTLR